MLLKALVPKTEAVAIPVQNLERITLAVAEDEKVSGEGVQGQEALNRLLNLSIPARMSVTPGAR